MRRILYVAMLVAGVTACGTHKNDFDATGTFEATEVVVSSEAAGRILSFEVEEGTQVNAGRTIGAIDSVQLYLSMLQLQKNKSSVLSNRPIITTQVAALKEQIQKQQLERKRIENLIQAKATTQKQLDDVNSGIVVLENQLSALQSTLQNNVSSLEAQSSAIDLQIAQIRDRLAKCALKSPISGIVLAKYMEAGELAVIGKPLFKVADMQHVYLKAYVSSGQLADLKLGQKVNVTADFGGEKTRKYEGRITYIASSGEFTPKSIQTRDDRENMVYEIKISVVNDGYIKLGMYGEVNF